MAEGGQENGPTRAVDGTVRMPWALSTFFVKIQLSTGAPGRGLATNTLRAWLPGVAHRIHRAIWHLLSAAFAAEFVGFG